jgi:hypothetical protein
VDVVADLPADTELLALRCRNAGQVQRGVRCRQSGSSRSDSLDSIERRREPSPRTIAARAGRSLTLHPSYLVVSPGTLAAARTFCPAVGVPYFKLAFASGFDNALCSLAGICRLAGDVGVYRRSGHVEDALGPRGELGGWL